MGMVAVNVVLIFIPVPEAVGPGTVRAEPGRDRPARPLAGYVERLIEAANAAQKPKEP